MTSKIETPPTPLTRILDSIDRGHARAADRLHTARNAVRDLLERGLDRAEAVVEALRGGLDKADKRAADGIIHAQSVVGSALVNGANNPPPPPPPEYRPRRVVVEEPETVVVRERRGPICHYERRKEWLGDGEFTYRRVEVCE